MNATLIISLSAVLVGIVLAMVFYLRSSGALTGTEVGFKGTTVDADGDSIETEIYYCDGGCNPYGADTSEGDFPGYFALIGFKKGDSTFLTEFSVGFTFEYDSSGSLVSCTKTSDDFISFDSVSAIVTGEAPTPGTTMAVDDIEFTVGEIITSPADSKVFGENPPHPSDCAALYRESVGDGSIPDDEDFLSDGRRDLWNTDEHGRTLWNSGTIDSNTAWKLSQTAYLNNGAPGGWRVSKTCKVDHFMGSAVAKFVYNGAHSTMVLTFAGTSGMSDIGDWVHNLDVRTHNSYHRGFWSYQNKLNDDCIRAYRNLLLERDGIELDYIIGHSLGGAAATTYALENGNSKKGVYTFGAPKSRAHGKSCSVSGRRIVNKLDSIASPLLGIMGDFNHDVTNSYQLKGDYGCGKGKTCKHKGVNSQSCTATHNDGCKWLFDCAYYFATAHLTYGEYLTDGEYL